jgi:RNA polymerase sigma-70 factor (ECF subfamily)
MRVDLSRADAVKTSIKLVRFRPWRGPTVGNPQHTDPPPEASSSQGRFVASLLAHQRGIHAFLVAILPHEDDLDDLQQQVCLALWEKRGQYDPARPFLPWAYAFARNHAFKYREAKSRERGMLCFSGSLLEQIAFAREAFDASIEERRRALDTCIQRLRPEQRELIRERFAGQRSLKDLAASSGVSPASLTMRLQRLRHALLKCIELALAAKEAT